MFSPWTCWKPIFPTNEDLRLIRFGSAQHLMNLCCILIVNETVYNQVEKQAANFGSLFFIVDWSYYFFCQLINAIDAMMIMALMMIRLFRDSPAKRLPRMIATIGLT